jgi:hypothetical protein
MSMHIVHAEGERASRYMLKSALTAIQPTISLHQFENSDDALKYIEAYGTTIDLFIVDLRLPGKLSGLELIQQVRTHGHPVNILATSKQGFSPRAVLQALDCKYVSQPWNLLELTRTIMQFRPVTKSPISIPSTSSIVGKEHEISSSKLNSTAKMAERCPNCHTLLADEAAICLQCGTIIKPDSGETTRRIQHTPQAGIKPQSSSRTTHSRGGLLTLHIAGEELTIPHVDYVILGRSYTKAVSADVLIDLTRFDAHGNGVSRRHVLIQQKDFVYVMDLGSTNGTFLNNQLMTPLIEQRVQSGDTLHLGYLEVGVEF